MMMSTIHNALLIDWMTFYHLSRRVPLLDKDVRICLNIYARLRPWCVCVLDVCPPYVGGYTGDKQRLWLIELTAHRGAD